MCGKSTDVSITLVWLSFSARRSLSSEWPTTIVPAGHNYMGHNYAGHNYMGHNYAGHNYLGHGYLT